MDLDDRFQHVLTYFAIACSTMLVAIGCYLWTLYWPPLFFLSSRSHLSSPKQESSPLPPTCGVPWVDDAEHPGLAVLLGRQVGPLQLLDVQGPAVGLVQVVVDVHGLQLWDGGRVQRVLRDGDHHARPGPALTWNQQLQDALQTAKHKGFTTMTHQGSKRSNINHQCCCMF